MSQEKILLELENISLKSDKDYILKNISFNIEKNKITTLIGPNGGGKTSIAKIILGIITPSSGKLIKKFKYKIGYMPQKIELNPTIPITANDFLKLTTGKNIKFDEDISSILKRLNLTNCLNEQLINLSGGELQKVIFVKSIITKPDLLILDEPTQYMDINAINEFYSILDELKKQNKYSIILISHDLNIVMKKTDSVLCINNHICCAGSPSSVHNHPDYLSLFKSEIGIYQHIHNHKH